MTVRDALKAVSAEGKWLVSYRAMITLPQSGRKADVWIGSCKYQNGELISLDGDYYSPGEEIERYEVCDIPGDWTGAIEVYLKLE